MSLKTILVNLNCESRTTELVAAAAVLARPEKAHVIGVFVTPPLLMPSVVVFPMGPAFYDEQIAGHRATAKRIKAIFDDLTRAAGFVAEWRVHGDVYTASQSIADGMIEEARTADLVIVSQGRGGLEPMFPDVAERVAIESGRPVLVIPLTWVDGQYGRNIAVAWNGSRKSTRAIFDALPLLERAERIRLVTVGAQMSENSVNTIPSTELAATMARHGLDVEVESIDEEETRTADAILSQIAVNSADLLVMGAYGHSRMRCSNGPVRRLPIILFSRTHSNATTEAAISGLPGCIKRPLGSSLKFALIAAGEADLYARFRQLWRLGHRG